MRRPCESHRKLVGISRAKCIGLRRNYEPIRFAPDRIVVGELGITSRRASWQRIETRPRERCADVSVARDRHPWFAPDQVEHALPRQSVNDRIERAQGFIERAAKRRGFALAIEDCAEQSIQSPIVERIARIGHDDVRHERARGIDGLTAIFVDVDDEMRRLKCFQPLEIGVLRAADFRYADDIGFWMDAKTGACDDVRAQLQREQQLGETRNKARDGGLRTGRMRDARPVDVVSVISRRRAAPRRELRPLWGQRGGRIGR